MAVHGLRLSTVTRVSASTTGFSWSGVEGARRNNLYNLRVSSPILHTDRTTLGVSTFKLFLPRGTVSWL